MIKHIFLCLLVCSTVFAQTSNPSATQPVNLKQNKQETLPQKLQQISVTIRANSTNKGNAEGSGVVKTRDGINYIWTAAHVVAGLRTERKIIDSKTGTEKYIIEFEDAAIIQNLLEDGRKVGQIEMLAEVIRYSDADHGEDLALLRVRKRDFINYSATFYLDDEIPSIGADLYHVGSLLGNLGSNSLTSGIISQHGRVVDGKVFDQTTVPAFPGSSGGGVFLRSNGQYIAMLTRGAGETFNLVVPMRRIRSWAKRTGVEFAIDDRIPVPNDEVLKNMPIEDSGKVFSSSENKKPHVSTTQPYIIVPRINK